MSINKTKLKRVNRKTNTGFKGVTLHKLTGKYETRVLVRSNTKSNNIYVGLYTTIPEAVTARNNFITNLL